MKTVPLAVDADHSYTLPAAAYTDPQIFELEKDSIFFCSWLFAGQACELKETGSYITREIFDQSVLIIKGSDEKIRAFYNVCSHRAHELLSGSGRTDKIQCPYHAWSYHINGSVNSIPGAENMDLEKAEFCLKPVRLEEFGSMLFINLDQDAEPMISQSPQVPGEIEKYVPDMNNVALLSATSHSTKSNWKVNVDNFVEFYHYNATHHDDIDPSTIDYEIVNHPNHIYQEARPAAPDTDGDKVTPDKLHAKLAYWYMWPNTGLSVFPGAPFFMVTTFEPDGPDTGCMQLKIYGDADLANSEIFEDFRKAKSTILQEDVLACESVQRGLHSKGYNQGRFIVDNEKKQVSESGVHHFHRMILKALES